MFNQKSETVDFICNQEGIQSLINQLKVLQKYGGHLHLMTPSWGGDDLAEEPIGNEGRIINHLKVILLPNK